MKMNRTLSVLAATAVVAVSAASAKAGTTNYITLTVSGTITEGFVTENAAGTKETFKSTATSVNNKNVLSLFGSWANYDGATVTNFPTSKYNLGVLWNYTTQEPVTGDIVVLSKAGALVYDPTASDPTHTFAISGTWLTPTIISGSAALLATNGVNIYEPTLGAGTINYEYQGKFEINDTTGEAPLYTSDLLGDGKGTGTGTYNATGYETKVGFKFEAFGTADTFLDGSASSGTTRASVDLIFSSGAVNTVAPTSTTSPSSGEL
jgi:hypothetical protein